MMTTATARWITANTYDSDQLCAGAQRVVVAFPDKGLCDVPDDLTQQQRFNVFCAVCGSPDALKRPAQLVARAKNTRVEFSSKDISQGIIDEFWNKC
jgi:hypothetical protein